MQLLENNLTRLNYNGEREKEREDEKWMLFTKYSRGKITVDGLNRYSIPTQ